ncbi:MULTISPECIES: RNA 2',3'-cyclic phosphodiesterase [Kitasatospora]|uniref:RNA 2',3'-cyclic phosphodiesterase n=1 Tax=Kitasatospora cathayae TaxID=3004092 RepID=A0ABY7Q420_9ACTN|nr:RNA 2',3'-cyclic phosphodiesterase [Kitasatospora sp. HUAS 3-15]WBP87445.1 RNA 2',3'-cyclic phosphodiesterase [Kitasatospora sp. HUAS 3-15]
MRLFVAVLPPVAALQGLSDAVAPVRGLPGADRLRWTTVEGWHLTLAFLGQVQPERLPELEAGLAAVAEVHPVHRLRIAGAGRFGDRVLWVGIEGQTWALRRLAESVAEATADLTGETDAFGFHPHLTLARAGSHHGHRRAVQRVAAAELEALAAALADYRGPEWEAAELHLMKSDLDGGFAHYESLRSWALADWS